MCTNRSRGIFGIVPHPCFLTNPYIHTTPASLLAVQLMPSPVWGSVSRAFGRIQLLCRIYWALSLRLHRTHSRYRGLPVFMPQCVRSCLFIFLLNYKPPIVFVAVHGWGQKGHEIVGNVAFALLSRQALRKIEGLLNISSANHTTNTVGASFVPPRFMNQGCIEYCTPLAIAADWANQVRFYKKWSSPLHYIDVHDDVMQPHGCPVTVHFADMAAKATLKEHYSVTATNPGSQQHQQIRSIAVNTEMRIPQWTVESIGHIGTARRYHHRITIVWIYMRFGTIVLLKLFYDVTSKIRAMLLRYTYMISVPTLRQHTMMFGCTEATQLIYNAFRRGGKRRLI